MRLRDEKEAGIDPQETKRSIKQQHDRCQGSKEMADSNPRHLFSAPEDDREIMSSWESFMEGRESGARQIRDMVNESWRRCLSADVDHRRYRAPSPIAQDDFELLREHCSELIDASAPVMASARDFLHETGTVMVLADPAGTVLSLEGDIALEDATQNIHLVPGASWSEFACGTNAIGTAIETGFPIQIHSNEHFCLGIKNWSCSAAVIRDPRDGAILGAIDISGLRKAYSRHSMALVVATAARIESRIAQIEMDFRYRLLDQNMTRLSSSAGESVVIFDRHGRAIKANADIGAVLRDLGAPREEAQAGAPALSFEWDRRSTTPGPLPPWIRPEWLTPIYSGNQRLGAVLTVPGRHAIFAKLRKGLMGASASEEPRPTPVFANIIGANRALLGAVERASRVAASNAPVLLLGETGVGKEVFARSLHEASKVAKGPFVALNCGGLSRDLLTSELFGYAEGSFTGARKGGMVGKIEAANGGTLFLDEIGEMPVDLQPLFLRVLEEREVCRIGETRSRKVDFRLVAATNRDLRKEVEQGRFRMDLFYRVSVVGVSIPALRDRSEDIPDLVRHFVGELSSRHGLGINHVSPGLIERLMQHPWPGNIRELRNVVESMLLTSNGPELTEADLPPDIWPQHDLTSSAQADQAPPELTPMECAERDAILRIIQSSRGNIAAMARELGIAKSTVYVKLRKFELEGHIERMRA
jgi:transcriptional regulator of acetoin/glycerol metabolism